MGSEFLRNQALLGRTRDHSSRTATYHRTAMGLHDIYTMHFRTRAPRSRALRERYLQRYLNAEVRSTNMQCRMMMTTVQDDDPYQTLCNEALARLGPPKSTLRKVPTINVRSRLTLSIRKAAIRPLWREICSMESVTGVEREMRSVTPGRVLVRT